MKETMVIPPREGMIVFLLSGGVQRWQTSGPMKCCNATLCIGLLSVTLRLRQGASRVTLRQQFSKNSTGGKERDRAKSVSFSFAKNTKRRKKQ